MASREARRRPAPFWSASSGAAPRPRRGPEAWRRHERHPERNDPASRAAGDSGSTRRSGESSSRTSRAASAPRNGFRRRRGVDPRRARRASRRLGRARGALRRPNRIPELRRDPHLGAPLHQPRPRAAACRGGARGRTANADPPARHHRPARHAHRAPRRRSDLPIFRYPRRSRCRPASGLRSRARFGARRRRRRHRASPRARRFEPVRARTEHLRPP